MNEPQPIPPGGKVPGPEPVVINLLLLPVLIATRGDGPQRWARYDPEPIERTEPTFDPMVWGEFTILGPVGESSIALPPQVEGTIFIVPEHARLLYPERRDLFSIYKPQLTYEDGQPIYATSGLVGWPAGVLRRVVRVGPNFEASR